jgi:hypothetical protein
VGLAKEGDGNGPGIPAGGGGGTQEGRKGGRGDGSYGSEEVREEALQTKGLNPRPTSALMQGDECRCSVLLVEATRLIEPTPASSIG